MPLIMIRRVSISAMKICLLATQHCSIDVKVLKPYECVERNALCIQDGVYLRDIVAFSFFRDSLVQVAIRPVGQEPSHGLTELHCEPGSHLYWFETLLRADFFTSQKNPRMKKNKANKNQPKKKTT
jgi:hypothetical protein